eukprot:8263764-Karenia_brevis.AAC.1
MRHWTTSHSSSALYGAIEARSRVGSLSHRGLSPPSAASTDATILLWHSDPASSSETTVRRGILMQPVR